MNGFGKNRNGNQRWQGIHFLLGLLGFLLLLGAMAGMIWLNQFHVTLSLNGPQEVTVEYGESYVDPGASAMLSGRFLYKNGMPISVRTSENFNPTVLGVYEVHYSAGLWKLEQAQNRKINIVDTVPPVIRLVGSTETIVLPGSEYTEEGFTATDNHDGDITDSVVCSVQDDSVIYYVKDQSGNATQVKRSLVYDDRTPPQLQLSGSDVIVLRLGEEYMEPGFSANDDFDGDITNQVLVEGDIDLFVPGEYRLRYSIQDSYGNASEVFRTVLVEAAAPIEPVVPSGKVIYLTFDDGPSCYTEKLLTILDEYDAKATFFVVDTDYSDMIAEIYAHGHSVGIHSASHVYRNIYASEQNFVSDLRKMQDVIEEKTGEKTYLMRFPGGSSNTVSSFNPGIMTRLTELVSGMGFQYFDWNVDSGDASGAKTPSEVSKNVISAVKGKDISIVLQHDSKSFSINAVETILQWGQENGYRFLALSPDSPCIHHGVNN